MVTPDATALVTVGVVVGMVRTEKWGCVMNCLVVACRAREVSPRARRSWRESVPWPWPWSLMF